MNDRALAAVSLAFLGAAWYVWQRSLQLNAGAQAAQASPLSFELPTITWPSFSLAAPVAAIESTAQTVFEEVANMLTPGPWEPPARAAPYMPAIVAAESLNGIPRMMLARLLYQESRFRPEIINGSVRSPAGALGIAQFMPATAAEQGIDPLDPDQAIAAAGRYLAQLKRITGDWRLALASYNWGVGNVTRRGMAAAPLETRNYVAQITSDIGYV